MFQLHHLQGGRCHGTPQRPQGPSWARSIVLQAKESKYQKVHRTPAQSPWPQPKREGRRPKVRSRRSPIRGMSSCEIQTYTSCAVAVCMPGHEATPEKAVRRRRPRRPRRQGDSGAPRRSADISATKTLNSNEMMGIFTDAHVQTRFTDFVALVSFPSPLPPVLRWTPRGRLRR